MKQIPLTQGKFALVDDEDHEFLIQWKWHAQKDHNKDKWYAKRNSKYDDTGKRFAILMHRLILERKLGRKIKEGYECDHFNEDGSNPSTLNNCREHLREATPDQNRANRTGGVYYDKISSKWRVEGHQSKQKTHLGFWRKEKDAKIVYDNWARENIGEFACLYYPDQFLTPKEKTFIERKASKYIGVGWDNRRQKWYARITFKKQVIFLGYFYIQVKAAEAYNTKAKFLLGSKAKLNYLEDNNARTNNSRNRD